MSLDTTWRDTGERITVDDLDVLMLRNDPAGDRFRLSRPSEMPGSPLYSPMGFGTLLP